MSKSRSECLRILGLPPTASAEEIKEAYRRKAKELHPDKNPEDREAATERFQELQEAYTCLVKEDHREDDEDIPEWLRVIIIMRERERRRRLFEQFFFGFGGSFNPFVSDDDDDDDEYEYFQDIFGNVFRRKRPRRPKRRTYYHNHWESNDFENYSNNTSSSKPNRYHGSAERNEKFNSGHHGNDNSPNPSPEWIPEQPKQSTTRSARQKKKKRGKKSKKRKQTSVRNGISHDDWDEESVTSYSTIDSLDTNISSEEFEEEKEDGTGLFKNEEVSEKIENCKTEESGANLKTEKNIIPPEKEKEKKTKDEYRNDEVNKDQRKEYAFKNESSNAGNGCIHEENSQDETTVKEKAKVKIENAGVGNCKKKCSDSNSEPSQANNDSKHTDVKFENKEKKDTRTSKNTFNAQPSQKNSFPDGGYNGKSKIIDESIFKEAINKFHKEENEEEDWNNWKFPKQEVNATNNSKGTEEMKFTNRGKGEKVPKSTNEQRSGEEVTKSTNGSEGSENLSNSTNKAKNSKEVPNSTNRGKDEKIPKSTNDQRSGEGVTKSTNGGKGGEKVSKSTTKESNGEKVPNSTNRGGKGEKLPKSTNKGKGDENVSKSSVLGGNNVKLPKGVSGYPNGKTHPSNKDLQHESIKKRYGGYIKKHSNPAHTERYKKLIDTSDM